MPTNSLADSRYSTTDITVAAGLVVLGYTATIEEDGERFVTFCFEISAEADADAIIGGTQTVAPFAFLDARRSLLRRADAALGRDRFGGAR